MSTDKTLADVRDGWPEYLMLRDTGLADDMGGLGQRIFTTAGAGYVKQKYVRADLAECRKLANVQPGGRVRLGDQAERAQWRSMDTCPRDGTVVRLRWGEDHVSPGWWSAPVSSVQNDDGTWPSDTGGFPWAFIDFNNGSAFVNHAVDTEYGPTHWAPYAALSAQPSPVHQIDAETLWWLQDAINTMAEGGNQSHVRFLQSLHDSLAAQPSPAGQGDAHVSVLRALRAVLNESGRSSPARNAALDAAIAALAARQPVGQEPVAVKVTPEMRAAFRRAYREGGFWADRLDTALDAMMRAAPPAQAVDLGPSQSVLAEVAQERARQEAKWGQQNHVDWTPTSAATDLAGAWPAGVGDHFKFITDYKAKGVEGHRLGYFDILMEEVAEAHDEARDGNTKATRAELVQVAAVAVAWIECIDRRLAVADSQAVGK